MHGPNGTENPPVDPACPQPGCFDTSFAQLIRKTGCRNHDSVRRLVKAAHNRPEPVHRKPGPDSGIIGKAGMERRGEGHAMRHAPGACAPANRPFGHDMNNVGAKSLERAACAKARGNRQPDFTITGHRHGQELIGRDQIDLEPALQQDRNSGGKTAHHPIDLRKPGVGCDGNSHAMILSALAFTRSRTCSAQSMIDIAPARSSTSAVQLSTQSPSL